MAYAASMPAKRHKAATERGLVAVRSQISAALDELSDGNDKQKMKEILEGAEKALRNVEIKAAGSRNPGVCHGDAIAEPSDEHTRNWLQTHFAGFDLDIATDSQDFAQSSPTSPKARRADVIESVAVNSIMTRAGCFDFDASKFAALPEVAGRPICVVGAKLEHNGDLIMNMEEHGRITDAKKFRDAFSAYFVLLDREYNPNPYHSSAHAADTMSTTAWMMRAEYLAAATTHLDRFMVLVASAIHDVGHPGKNNYWCIKTQDDLATRYNDKSCLENMHVSKGFDLMRQNAGSDWFGLMKSASGGKGTPNVQAYVRKGLIAMVLATDAVKHAEHSKKLTDFVHEEQQKQKVTMDSYEPEEGSKQETDQKALEDKLFMFETILHGADVSNPTKPTAVMLNWTRLLLNEFWEQGDEERRMGIPITFLCDREVGFKTVPNGQIGFARFVIQPYYMPMAELMPEVKEATDQLTANIEYWMEREKECADYNQVFASLIAAAAV